MKDREIIEKVLKGDSSAFEVLILKYQNQVYYSALNILKNNEYAEDICQDAFLKAYEKLDTLQDKDHFLSWIKRIVDVASDDKDIDYFDNLTDGACPEDFIIKDELSRYIKFFVDSLPERLKTVVILREVEDLSYEEISEMLNIPLGTVRSRLFNARQIIKERLIKQGLTDQVVLEA